MSESIDPLDVNATPDVQDTAEMTILGPKLKVESFGVTDLGRCRATNEDQFLVATLYKALKIGQTSLAGSHCKHSSDRSHLFIVADGMGGEAAGEKASAMALDFVERYVLESLLWFATCRPNAGDRVLSEFRTALSQAHASVRQEAEEHPKLHGMGSTVTLAYSLNEVLYVAHVGDSRCYLFRENRLHRLTKDHTLTEEMVSRGELTPEAAAKHHWRHVITSSVGGNSPDVRVDVHRLELEAGDQVLLCSDGLTNMVTSEEIIPVLKTESTTEGACRKLVDLANLKGGKDNITVVLARYTPED